jgi:tetratricopeptide (TPR) repeat protein
MTAALLALTATLALWLMPSSPVIAQATIAEAGCELNKVSRNRWDYRRERWPEAHKERFEWQLKDLEVNHFRPQTEMLLRPTTGRTIGSDLHYVLTLWPNHHRTLLTLVRLGEREHTDQPKDTFYTIACYFERGLNYTPDDTVMRGLYAYYLAKRSDRPRALHQLELLKTHADQNPLAHHNAGLIYLEMQEFDRALEQAHRAEQLGLPPNNRLRSSLETAGKWRAPESGLASPVPAASAASSGS